MLKGLIDAVSGYELSIYNIITIVLVAGFFLSSGAQAFMKKNKRSTTKPAKKSADAKEKEYRKRMKEEADSLIAQANSGMDMGDGYLSNDDTK